MQWTGEGLIIGVRRHGESSVIAEVMVEGRGRHLGLIRGGRSAKHAAALQAGNSVQLTWRARLEEHLGTFVLEVTEARAARLIADRTRLYAAQLLCDHLRLLPERDPNDRLLGQVIKLLDRTDPSILGVELARFELTLLEELGFGLDATQFAFSTLRGDFAVEPGAVEWFVGLDSSDRAAQGAFEVVGERRPVASAERVFFSTVSHDRP